MNDLTNTKGLDLEQESLEDLKLILENELYIDIDSPFAAELMKEIEKRQSILEPNA